MIAHDKNKSIEKLRSDVIQNKEDQQVSSNGVGDVLASSVTAGSVGYGGKFGVQHDRVDKSAHGFAYQPPVEKHSSQTGTYKN